MTPVGLEPTQFAQVALAVSAIRKAFLQVVHPRQELGLGGKCGAGPPAQVYSVWCGQHGQGLAAAGKKRLLGRDAGPMHVCSKHIAEDTVRGRLKGFGLKIQ